MTERQWVQFPWKLKDPKLRFAFLKYGGNTFTDKDWTGREAAKHDFRTARILATLCCVFVLCKDTLEEI